MMNMAKSEFTQISDQNFTRLLNPRSTILVTCCDSEGKPNVLSVAWHSALSIDPPLVGISISPKRYSHDLIASTREYIIHIVGPEMKEAVLFCGTKSGKEMDKISRCNLTVHPAKFVKPPVLSNAYGYMECEVEQAVTVGDHTWFVGKVLYAGARTGFFTDAWDASRAKILLYLKLDQYGYFHDLE